MSTPTRPVLRYHGGKWLLTPWVMQFFPPHSVYVEPFCGAASVLMRKPRAAAELINDLDARVVHVFRILRDPVAAAELRRRLRLTPFARAEFDAAYDQPTDDIDAARKTIVLAFMGHGSDTIGRGYRTGFRSKASDSRALPSNEWAGWPEQVPLFVERLRGVTIEQRDAREIIARLDSPRTLFYLDPPYPFSTRTSARTKHGYRHEMQDDEHRDLARLVRSVLGMVVISGYPCSLYDSELFPDWERHERPHLADGARIRTEVVWLSPSCSAALATMRIQGRLLA